jgi:hypothetical protein
MRFRITRNIERHSPHHRRWGYATLPSGSWGNRRPLRLIWAGPLFILAIPKGD